MDGSAKNYGRIGTKCLAEPSNQFEKFEKIGEILLL